MPDDDFASLPLDGEETASLVGAASDEVGNPIDERLTSADTVDLKGRVEPKELPSVEAVDEFVQHLEDACPVITYDREEAEEVRARYVIGQEIGRGSIGQVIEAHDEHLSRRIAIKVLHGDANVSKDRLSRFIAESQITAQLEHPTIVPVYEIGRMPGGMPYFAMKRVRGESLDDVINYMRVGDESYLERFDGRQRSRMFFRLCQGIAYAHARGVVHRDLKPANIMIGEFGVVQIMDWGLAKVMGHSVLEGVEPVASIRGAEELATLDGSIAGTPAYMSPEQARGDVEAVGPESDVYSLGLMLAELMTLHRVYRGAEPQETLEQICNAGPVDLEELAPEVKVDVELAAIVAKCTEPGIENRYRHAGQLMQDLRQYLEDRAVSVQTDQHHRRVMKWTRRNPLLAGIAIGAGATALLHALGYGWLSFLLR